MHKGIQASYDIPKGFGEQNQNPDLGISISKWAYWSRNPVNPYTDYWLNQKPAKIQIIWENPNPEMSKSNMDCWGNQAEIRII